MKNKTTVIFFVNLFICFILTKCLVCNCKVNLNQGKKILIIASYSVNDEWETSIIQGFKSKLKNEDSIKVEFLDSRLLSTKEYDESFINLLNIKYRNNIDYILTLDDEAFKIARKNLFNENLFTYKKPIIFIGVNDYINLTKEESQYITGIIEYQDNLMMINTVLETKQNIENIYLLLDKSIYSYTFSKDVKNLVEFADRPYKVYTIEGVYYNDIINEINNINPKNSVILLCSTYKDVESNENIKPEILVNNIKGITKVPIYTTLKQYVLAGAIGGIVNDGYKVGIMASSILESIIAENNVYNIAPPHDTFSIPMFNYKAIREYNINPLKLPKGSVYINKKFYNLLLPKYMIVILWTVILLFIIGLILLLYLFLSNKKRAKHNKLLWVESVEREKIKTDFIVTISHELRTPLNIIINATNLLKMKIENNDLEPNFFYEKLNYIMKSSQRLRRYINNLIDVNRLELGYMNTKFSNENIVEVVEDVVLTIVDLAKKYNIEVVFDTEEEEIITAIDKVKIERVILNLLSNAIKFTKDNGVIMVWVNREFTNVVIKISDNGIGMNEETKKHIFEKFKRADLNEGLNRQNEGSGLGLFIVKGLIDLHKGSIKLDSELNKGTEFTITLPIKVVETSEREDVIVGTSLEYMANMEFSDLDKKE